MKMRKWHRNVSIIFLLPLLLSAITGVFLTQRARLAWMMPEKHKVASQQDFRSMPEVMKKLEEIDGKDNVGAIIYYPSNHQYVVRTKNYREIHLHASTLEVLNEGPRLTTLLIMLHEGSYFGLWARETIFFLSAVALVFLCVSGWFLWLGPKRKRRSKAKSKAI